MFTRLLRKVTPSDCNRKRCSKASSPCNLIAPPAPTTRCHGTPTYLVDGIQYVSIMAGWGGSAGLYNDAGMGPVKPGYGKILTFSLGASATLKTIPFGHKDPPTPVIKTTASKQVIHLGGLLYFTNCAACHGIFAVAGPLPDLRYADKQTLEGIEGIVLGGSRVKNGMPSFKNILTPGELRAIQAYIVSRAWESAKPGEISSKP